MGVVDEVKDRLDIAEVVSSYLRLEKSGRNFKALCPFHNEKTPSFVVFPDSQRWYCFGACNEGGDVYNFVMKMEGWDFRTALEELANQAGVDLKPRTPQQAKAAEEADRLRDLLAAAARYYYRILTSSPEAKAARAYVENRGLTEESVDAFQIGYSLPGWDRLRDYLTEQGYSVDDLLKAGLVAERDSGGTYDQFRERLMIPIRDGRGRDIGFGARTLDPEGVPKYLNSPKTMLFDKSETLFGLDLARRSIRREDRAVIVEGYMDVMQAHQAGYENVVAQMGTALTEAQLKKLQRYSKRMILALDPDAAGVQATLRGVEVAQETLEKEWQPIFNPRGLVGFEGRLGADMRVLRLPSGQDPDDVIRRDAERWAELVEEAVPVVDFYLELLTADIDLDDTKAKAEVVDKILPVLEAVTNPVEREDYVQKIARSLRVDERAVLRRVEARRREGVRRRRSPGGRGAPAETHEEGMKEQPDAILERHCLSALLRRPSILSQVNYALHEAGLDSLEPRDFEVASLRAVFEAWSELLETRPAVSTEALEESLPVEVRERLEDLIPPDDTKLADEQLVRDVVVTLLRLRQRRLKAFVQDLKLLMLEAREDGDVRGKQYDQAHLVHTQKLLQTQRALARSRELG
ncbi:MAG: DNA primase [Anaerolineae bacterium]|jgi:DNA primase